jgi:GTP-binding protein Era
MRAGFVSLMGLPNAGKSSLYNALLGENLAIVSRRSQSTRKTVRGVLSGPNWQLILVDAPGILETPKRPLHKFMQDIVEVTHEGADLILAVLNLDADKKEQLLKVIEQARSLKKPWLAIVTKTDLPELSFRKIALEKELQGTPTLEFSSKWKGEDLTLFKDSLLSTCLPLLPEQSDFLVEPELLSLEKEKDLVSEMILESCFEHLFEEVPHYLAISVRDYNEYDPTLVRIHADLLISKESHKAIVIGQKGEMLKQMGARARARIETFLRRKVFLKLHVVLKKDWEKSPQVMKSLGYELSKRKVTPSNVVAK